MFESGGNPRAINRTDSNWFAGHPSVGIAQVIRGTFQANAGRYRGVGPFAYGVSMNPYANSYAGGHYAVGRYGSLAAVDPRVRPMGYDRGGFLPPGGLALNATSRPEALGFDYDKLAAAVVKALQTAPPRVAVDDIHQGLLRKKHTTLGGMNLGLT
jgi:SLT domain-containing protein